MELGAEATDAMRVLAVKWGSRVVVLAACLLLGWLMAGRIALFAGLARATWLEIETAHADNADPKLASPKVIAQTKDGTVHVEASLEEAAASVDIVGIKPLSGAPLHVDAVYADGARVSLPRKSMDARWVSAEIGDTVSHFEVTTPGFFILPKSARSLTIVVAPPPAGDVEVSWRNRTTLVKGKAQASGVQEIAIDAAPADSGWLLLPPTPIADLEIAVSTGAKDLAIERVILHASPAQIWAADELARSEAVSPDCPARHDQDLLLPAQTMCRIALIDLRPINTVPVWLRLGLSGAVALALLGGLALLRRLGPALARRTEIFALTPTRLGEWIEQVTAGWRPAHIALSVAIVAMIYQVLAALVIPPAFSPDSVDYYAYARNLAGGIGLAGVETFRTPGYPIFLSALIRLFGDQMAAIALMQHLILASLAPLAALLLYRNAGPLAAAVAGLAAGVSPLTTVLASYIWTEALFAALLTLVLLLSCRYTRGLLPGLFIGCLCGAATLVRPTGLLIVGFILAWSFLRWLCADGRSGRGIGAFALAMVLGYGLIAYPWYSEVHRRDGVWALSTVTEFYGKDERPDPALLQHPTEAGDYVQWLLLLYNGRSPATLEINRPYRSLMEFFDWRGGYTITRILPLALIADDRYPTEVVRESIRTNPQLWASEVMRLLKFNMFLARDTDPRLVEQAELTAATATALDTAPASVNAPPSGDPAAALRTADGYIEAAPRRDMAVQWKAVETLMKWMAFEWQPPSSLAKSALLAMDRALLRLWIFVASGVLCGTLVALLVPGLRWIAALGIFWLGMAIAHAAMGIAGERYMLVNEPLLYALIGVVGIKLLSGLPLWLTRPAGAPQMPAEGRQPSTRSSDLL
jgi:hypothetical protein